MKKNIVAGCMTAVAILVPALSVRAHHSLSEFDTTQAVRVRGVLVRFERVNPHSFLYLDQQAEDGRIERWAVEGPAVRQLERMGIGREMLKAGDVIEACGYVPKEGFGQRETVSTGATIPPDISGRLLTAEQLIMPDGTSRPWSDYGQHHCLGPDYVDVHVN